MSLSTYNKKPAKSKSTPVFTSVARGVRGAGFRAPFNSGAPLPNIYKSVNKKDYDFDFVGGCKFVKCCGCKYWPWFKNIKYKGAQSLSMLNILASWWHFSLAIIIVLVSVLNSDIITDGTDLKSPIIRGLGVGSLILCHVLSTFFAFYIYYVIKAEDIYPMYKIIDNDQNITPNDKRTIECFTCFLTKNMRNNIKTKNRNAKCIVVQWPLNMNELSQWVSITLWSTISLTFILGCVFTFYNIEGSYPVVLSSSITSLDNIPPPFDSPWCDGEKYTDALKWIKCIGDNQQHINRTLYDQITGASIPWRDAAGNTCEDLLTSKGSDPKCAGADNPSFKYPPTNGWTSDEACVGCAADGPGGEECTRRGAYSCVFNSSLNNFEALSGSENDPTRIIPRPSFEIYTGTEEYPLFAWVFIFVFSLLTSMFHCFLGTMAYYHNKQGPCGIEATYVDMIVKGRSPLRWLEYSITSAIMFTLVLTINRVTDIFIIIFAFIISLMYNTFGAAIDYIDNATVITWMWIISFFGFSAQFICLFLHFNLAIAPYIDPDITESSDLWGQFFDIIRIINWGLLITFSTFPIVSLFHQCYKYKCKICKWVTFNSDKEDKNRIRNCMSRAEIAYIWLSFFSKSLLIITMLLGTSLRRNNSSED